MATVFVGGSALLLAGGLVALAFGFVNEEESLVLTALLASIAAAGFLVIAYIASKRELRRGREGVGSDGAAVAAQPAERPAETVTTEQQTEVKDAAADESGTREHATSDVTHQTPDDGGQATGEDTGDADRGGDARAGAGAPARTSGSPTAKPETARAPSAPETVAAAKPNAASETVVGIPSKKKFHRLECRYARSEGAEEMSRATARKRGYSACGICKP